MHTSTIHEFMASERSNFDAFRKFLKTQISEELISPELLETLQSNQIFTPIYQGIPSYKTWLELLCRFTGLPSTIQIPEGYTLKENISFEFAKKQHMIPLLHQSAGTSAYIFANPFSLPLLDWLEYSESTQIYLATPFWIEEYLESAKVQHAKRQAEAQTLPPNLAALVNKVERHLEPQAPSAWSDLASISSPLKPEESGPAQTFLHQLFQTALAQGISHIHLTPEAEQRVSWRVGQQVVNPPDLGPIPPHAALLLQLKLMGQLDIGQQETYQAGEVLFQAAETLCPLRLRIIPLVGGEKAILSFPTPASQAGALAPEITLHLEKALLQPGLILSLGANPLAPFQSLFGQLGAKRQILAVNTHLQSRMAGVQQHVFQPHQGLNYGTTLKLLSHEMDILLLDGVQFMAQPEGVCRLALEGKTLVVPLAFREPAAALLYLLEQNLPPYLLGSALALLCVEYTLNSLCTQCRIESPEPAPATLLLGRHYQASGCEACQQTGQAKPLNLWATLPWNQALEARLYTAKGDILALRECLQSALNEVLQPQLLTKIQAGEVAWNTVQGHFC